MEELTGVTAIKSHLHEGIVAIKVLIKLSDFYDYFYYIGFFLTQCCICWSPKLKMIIELAP